MAPGFGLPPEALRPLAEAVQARAPAVRLWVALAAVDFAPLASELASAPSMTPPQMSEAVARCGGAASGALEGARRAAEAAGFRARVTGWGRVTNLCVLAHSASGLLFRDAAFAAAGGGAVLLASALNAEFVLHSAPNTEDWDRPLLLLGGELDGQMRWPWLAPHLYSSAALADKAGASFAAAQRPAVLVPGANHSQTAAPPPGAAGAPLPGPGRGDAAATADRAAATEGFAAAVAAFVTANAPGAAAGARAEAGEALRAMCLGTAEAVAPWFAASGMGDVTAPWRPSPPPAAGAPPAPRVPGGGPPAALLQGTFRCARPCPLSDALHPGVVQSAEAFARDAQRRLLSSLPAAVAARVRVVAAAHTDPQALLHSQPRIVAEPDGSLLLIAHVLLSWRAAGAAARGSGHGAALGPAAPEYWLKLKRPQAVAEALGLAGSFPDGTTPRELQSATLAAALAAAPRAAAARHASAGRRLAFAEADAWPGLDAAAFFREAAMRFEEAGGPGGAGPAGRAGSQQGAAAAEGGPSGAARARADGGGGGGAVVRVRTPLLVSPSAGELAAGGGGNGGAGAGSAAAVGAAAEVDPAYTARFLGNWYAKVASEAMLLEWVLLDSLRPGPPVW